jgi:carbonic anhydrase/acetyltransferase-like protein (isoleucine patch superfamily)
MFIETFLGQTPKINQTAFISKSAAIIGAVEIGKNCSVWHHTTIRGDANFIKIGEGTNIQDNSVIHIDSTKFPTIIGNHVTIGHSAIIHACTLESHSFIGMGSIIMDGAIVNSFSMVAAGALVTPGKKVPKGELWAGSPAKKMRNLTDEEFEMIEISAIRYIEVGKAARLGESAGPFSHFSTKPIPNEN